MYNLKEPFEEYSYYNKTTLQRAEYGRNSDYILWCKELSQINSNTIEAATEADKIRFNIDI